MLSSIDNVYTLLKGSALFELLIHRLCMVCKPFSVVCVCVCVCVCVLAGLGNAERTLVQHQWMDGQIPIIVATISFGMGVDKANVRSIKLQISTLQ